MYAYATEGEFYSWYKQKMRKQEFNKFIEVRFEKRVFEVQKSEKITLEISIRVKI